MIKIEECLKSRKKNVRNFYQQIDNFAINKNTHSVSPSLHHDKATKVKI